MPKEQHPAIIFHETALRYQEQFMHLDLYNDGYNLLLGLLERKDASVLDLACGPGNITRYLLNKMPGLKVFGIDLAPAMIELAEKNNPEARFAIMDIGAIASLEERFDAIICGFGLPYLNKEAAIQLIEDAAALLHPGGLLYLSTMEDDYARSGPEAPSFGGDRQLYIHYHEAGYLCEALQTSGFTVLEMLRSEYPQEGKPPLTDLVLIARRKPRP